MIITFVQIPHPIQSDSEMLAILSTGVTSMQSFPGVRVMCDHRYTYTHVTGTTKHHVANHNDIALHTYPF